MTRTTNKLNDRRIQALASRGLYGDGGGLYLQVGPTGGKSWLFRFMINRQARSMGLGPYPIVRLAEAREKAASLRKLLVVEKVDPLAARQSERALRLAQAAQLKTFEDCAEAYLNAHSTGWRNAKHAAQWRSTLETYVYPVIGKIPVSTIDVGMVIKILQRGNLWTDKPETASRVRGRIEAILDYATASDLREGKNPASWKGGLAHLLPPRKKVRAVRHHPALPYKEAPDFVGKLRGLDSVAARGLEFAILTAARTGEVIGATWAEIDFEDRVWTVPADRMKGGREHRVPLPDRAVTILRKMAESRTEASYIFPGGKTNSPLSNMAFLQLLKRMGRGDLTTHGFRSTFRDWAAEQTGFPREVAEMALAHAIGDKVEAAYRRGDLFEKRRRLMSAWAEFCALPSASSAQGNVASLRRA